MKKIVAITPADAGNGLGCCGATHHIASAEEAEQVLAGAMADPDTGVLILDERLLAGIGEEVVRAREQHWPGVLVILPAPDRSVLEEDYAARLIRRAVGYHVRVRT